MSDDDGVLGDHQRHRTKFTPPLVDEFGDSLQTVYWCQEEVPELLWVGLLFENLEPQRANEIVLECAETAQELFDDKNYVKSIDYDDLTEDDFELMGEQLEDSIILDLSQALKPLSSNYPSFPQQDLVSDVGVSSDDLDIIADVVDKMSDRSSRRAMLAQTTFIYVLAVTERMIVPPEFGDFNEIIDYPETDESRRLASSVRAAVKAMTATEDHSGQSQWATRFWEQGFQISDCVFPHVVEDPEDPHPHLDLYREMATFGEEFNENIRLELMDIWWDAPVDVEFTGKFAVLDGLLMRQVSLATTLAKTPALWSADTAGMILRCMAETHITLEWLHQEGTDEEYDSFIEYGLGQKKLFLQHAFEYISEYEGDVGDIEARMEELERSLEEQRYTHLLPVDVGNWNINTRQMAQDADCEDVYNLRFQFHSGTVHGMWNALEEQNLTQCLNPLHNNHRIPEFRPPHKIPFAVVEAGNLLNRSLDSWSQARDVDLSSSELLDLSANAKDIIESHLDGLLPPR